MYHVIAEDISLTTYSSYGLIVIIYGMIVIWLLSIVSEMVVKLRKKEKTLNLVELKSWNLWLEAAPK
jgi:hypothetical protein